MTATPRLVLPRDDALVRALLRENVMQGWVDMTVEREPSFFAGCGWAGREWAVIGEESGEVVGMYTAAMRPTHVNGREEQLGYLGGMRIGRSHRHRIRHVRAGYESVRRLAPVEGTLPWWFTVVGSGNRPARRLLEAGLPGLPKYEKQADYVTFALPTSRGRALGRWRAALGPEAERIASFHNRCAARFQFSPVLTAGDIGRIGIDKFLVVERDGELAGCVALWNQDAFKQVVIRGYRRPIGALRPAYNVYARLFRRCPLPRAGQALRQTFLAFLALDERAPAPERLLADALAHCRTPVAVMGLHAGNPLGDVVDRMKPVRYPAGVYTVVFDAPAVLDHREAQPEAALL